MYPSKEDRKTGKLKRILKSAGSGFKGFCNISTLHGFDHVFEEGNKWFESCFWSLVCLSGCIMAIAMVTSVWLRFQRTPTMTTIENNFLPVENIPFPAITICNTNKILKSSAMRIIEKFVSVGADKTHVTQFLKVLPQIYTTRLESFPRQEEMGKYMKKLGYNIETLMFELAQPCPSLLLRCMWLGTEYNCSSMFMNLKTPEGFCCSFNWQGEKFLGYPGQLDIRSDFEEEVKVERDEQFKKWLYTGEASTSSAGLTVVIDSALNDYFSSVDSYFGSAILLHKPDQFPDISVPRAYVQPRFEVMFRLSGTIIESSSNVRDLSLTQRHCFFEDEDEAVAPRQTENYNYDACALECKLNNFEKVCGCVPFYYPRENHTKVCKLTDMKCLRDNRGLLSSQDINYKPQKKKTPNDKCNCLPSCSSADYSWIMLGNKIYSKDHASPIFQNNLSENSALSVFFTDNFCIKYKKESLMTWDGLLAAFGGIIGLCLGGSIVSLIEILYYLIYKIVIKKMCHRRRRKVISNIRHVENYLIQEMAMVTKKGPIFSSQMSNVLR